MTEEKSVRWVWYCDQHDTESHDSYASEEDAWTGWEKEHASTMSAVVREDLCQPSTVVHRVTEARPLP
jgi:hypothetical protein